MKKIAIFGGSGGLGNALTPLLSKKYIVSQLSSKDVDVTDFMQVREFFKVSNYDIVLNFVGINYDVILNKIQEDDIGNINKLLNVNIGGHANVLANCLPKMIEGKYGRIIGISSVLSELNVPSTAIYSTTKAAIDKLYKVANKENIRYGITCNTIQLGYWEVGMIEELSPDFQEQVKKSIGLRRWGKIEELYNAIEFIINTEYYCGNNMKLNGGI